MGAEGDSKAAAEAKPAPEQSKEAAGEAKPAQLERVARPDDAKKNEATRGITEKIDKLIDERQKIDKQQQVARAGNKPFNDKRRTLVTQLKELRGKRGKLLDAAQDLQKKVDALISKDKEMKQKDKAAQQSLKFRTVEEADAKIAELERKYETTSMPPKQEKEMLKEISTLKQTRRKVEEYLKSKSGASSGADNIPAMRDQMREKRKEADGFKGEIEALSKELDELKEKNKGSVQKADKLQKRRNEIQAEINGLFQERNEIKKKHDEEWKKFKAYMTELNKQRDEERREREVKFKAEREAYEKMLEEEEAKKKPWEEEIALCDFLVAYLEKLANKKKDAAAPAAAAASDKKDDKPEIRKSGDDFGGFKAIGKSATEQDDFLVMGGAKKKKKSKKKETGRLTLSIDTLASFSLIGLKAPAKLEDIPASIKELKDKRAHYDVLPRAPKTKKKAADAADAADADAKPEKKKKQTKKAAAPSVDSAELFPELPGSKQPTSPVPAASSGPSAVDMVKSQAAPNGVAPPAGPEPTPAEAAGDAAEE